MCQQAAKSWTDSMCTALQLPLFFPTVTALHTRLLSLDVTMACSTSCLHLHDL